jgi:hypothetical protein
MTQGRVAMLHYDQFISAGFPGKFIDTERDFFQCLNVDAAVQM